jgi:hypothetical protein
MRTTLLAIVIATSNCLPTPAPTPAPLVQLDGAVDADPCASAERWAITLGCVPVPPTTGTWGAACRNARSHGLTYGVQCVLRGTTRSDVETCGVWCQ